MPAQGLICGEQAGPAGCVRGVFSRGLCRHHYRRVARGLSLEEPAGPKVGDRSGFGRFGLLDVDGDGRMLCHECGRWYVALGVHVGMVHGSARDYRLTHGLRMSQPLAATSLRRALSEASKANGAGDRIRGVSTREAAFAGQDKAMVTRGIRLRFDTAGRDDRA